MKKIVFILLFVPAFALAGNYKVHLFDDTIYQGQLIKPVTRDTLKMIVNGALIKIPRNMIFEIEFPNGKVVEFDFMGEAKIKKVALQNPENKESCNYQIRLGYCLIPGYCSYGIELAFVGKRFGFLLSKAMNSNKEFANNYYERVTSEIAGNIDVDNFKKHDEYKSETIALLINLNKSVSIGCGACASSKTVFYEYSTIQRRNVKKEDFILKGKSENSLNITPWVSCRPGGKVFIDCTWNFHFNAPFFSMGLIL